jgi:hypothetical protein
MVEPPESMHDQMMVMKEETEKKNKIRKLTSEEQKQLREKWIEKNGDIMSGVPDELPPLREINHCIPLIEEKKRYNYHLPRCPEALRNALSDKLRKYEDAGWWVSQTAEQAAPMLCIPKKNGKLRTVVDCRKRNDNTVRDVTPLPDQDSIRTDVARAKYRSKIDLSNAYEQIRIVPEDVPKTAFATIYGTFVSQVMQQGDCNAPATFQRLMTLIFREHIGRSVHAYIDDVFVYSDTVEEHEKHLEETFQILRKNHLYLEAEKCSLYAESMDCLGHVIDDRGIHADADKMARIHEWRTPRNVQDVQRFLGLVNYIASFMPDVSSYTGPIASLIRAKTFKWRPIHERCLEMIKALACKYPILKPIDPRTDETIWVICDASKSGIGAMYGQGKEWMSCRPAGFLSRKFTSAQHNYRVWEMEMLAILQALQKWEDKLLGYQIKIVSDHQALKFFKNASKMTQRQTRWMEFLERFNYEIIYVKGETNVVADALSRYYHSDEWDEHHVPEQYVDADSRLDPDGEDLPWNRVVELRAMIREP